MRWVRIFLWTGTQRSYEGDINFFKWNCIFSNTLIDAARHSLQNCMKLFISKRH